MAPPQKGFEQSHALADLGECSCLGTMGPGLRRGDKNLFRV